MLDEFNKVVVCLPAYNEAANLPLLLKRFEAVLQGMVHEYVICDDGSVDCTPGILREWQKKVALIIITHSPNQGLGATLRDLLVKGVAIAGDAGMIVTMDSDNTHPPELLPQMFAKITSGCDLVIASRYEAGAEVAGLSVFRRMTSDVASMLFRMLVPMRGVRDYTCGYRVYRNSLLTKAFALYGDAFFTEKGFTCIADILLKMRSFPVVVREVGLSLRYEMKKGESKMHVGSTVCATLRLMVQRRIGIGMRKPCLW
jgi:dolichol-phosphate mannosyltransferase